MTIFRGDRQSDNLTQCITISDDISRVCITAGWSYSLALAWSMAAALWSAAVVLYRAVSDLRRIDEVPRVSYLSTYSLHGRQPARPTVFPIGGQFIYC